MRVPHKCNVKKYGYSANTLRMDIEGVICQGVKLGNNIFAFSGTGMFNENKSRGCKNVDMTIIVFKGNYAILFKTKYF